MSKQKFCKNHPDRPVRARGLCGSCYEMWRRKHHKVKIARESLIEETVENAKFFAEPDAIKAYKILVAQEVSDKIAVVFMNEYFKRQEASKVEEAVGDAVRELNLVYAFFEHSGIETAYLSWLADQDPDFLEEKIKEKF